MQDFHFEALDIKGLFIIQPFYMEDERGYFMKNYEKNVFAQAGIETNIFEQFETFSKKNVVRGLHYQSVEPQSKLVRVIHGEIYDVAVDIRVGSPTFKQWRGILLSSHNQKQFFIPSGFAHGFLVLSDEALVSYTVSGKYLKKYDTGIVWNDPDIGIDWPIKSDEDLIISEKDKGLPLLVNADPIRTDEV